MIKSDEIEEIKNLIKNGYDAELISFELDIPLKEIKQLKKEMEKVNKKNDNKKEYTKIEQLRNRYKNLFYKDSREENTTKKELTQEQFEIIETCINKVKKIIEQMKGQTKQERRKKAIIILREINKIQDYQLTIEQAEILSQLLNVQELQKLKINQVDDINNRVWVNKKRMNRKLAEAIDVAQSKTDNLEQLIFLEKKITSEMEKMSPIIVGTVKNRLNNRITKIRQQRVLDKVKNNISDSIEKIIQDLANGTIDIENAKKVIEEEAKKRVKNKPKNKFTLTEEQEKRQILIQIRSAIKEKSEKFHLKNPETTIIKIRELDDISLGQAIGIVIENLISANKFEEAKKICDKFENENKEYEYLKEIRRLRKLIRNAEISSIVLRLINMQGTTEEENKCIELIEEGIKRGNINLKAISLGKSQDGTKNISLADIWTDEDQKAKI